MKNLNQNLEQARDRKDAIISNPNPYYYNVKVPYQHLVNPYQESKLIQDLAQADNKKNAIISNQNSYYYNVKVPYQHLVKTYQESKLTSNISVAEMPDSWLFGRGFNGDIAYGINNIADPTFIHFNSEKISEVRQKIIEKTGYTNIELPSQNILLFVGGNGVSLSGVNNTGSGAQVAVYQVDSSGNFASGWQPNAETYNGSIRFFYKATVEINHTATNYRDEIRFDSDRYNRDIAKADQDIKLCKTQIENLKLTAQTHYRDETRFDSDRYNRDITKADQDIWLYKTQIDNLTISAQTQLNNTKLNINSLEKDTSSLQSKLDKFNHQYKTIYTKHEDFLAELQHKQTQKKLLEQNIINQEKNTLITQPNQISTVKQEIKYHQVILPQKEEILTSEQEKLIEAQSKFKSQIELMTLQQRAYIFAETFGIAEKEFILKIIDSLGLDAESLGFYAITKNNKELLETALHYKADFGSYYYDGKSLLQHLIKAGNKELIDFVLSLEGQDFGSTLFSAIAQNDLLSINTILAHNPYLLGSLHEHGYSLLHAAVSLHKVDVIKTLLEFDSTLVDIKSTDLESPIAVALRQNIPEVTSLLLPYINFKHEIENLTNRGNIDLISTLEELDIMGQLNEYEI